MALSRCKVRHDSRSMIIRYPDVQMFQLRPAWAYVCSMGALPDSMMSNKCSKANCLRPSKLLLSSPWPQVLENCRRHLLETLSCSRGVMTLLLLHHHHSSSFHGVCFSTRSLLSNLKPSNDLVTIALLRTSQNGFPHKNTNGCLCSETGYSHDNQCIP